MLSLGSSGERDPPDENDPPGGRKKNTKLGYQRTSVACSHCRRRKIRCQPNETDPTAPCVNCQRTNKECIVTPVQDSSVEGDRPRVQVADTSSSLPRPNVTPSLSTQTSLQSDDQSRLQQQHQSSYDIPLQRTNTYQDQMPPTTYSFLDHNRTTWGSPVSAPQPATSALHLPQDTTYYNTQTSQHFSPASPENDYPQQSSGYHPHPFASSTVHPSGFPPRSLPRSTSYTGSHQAHHPYPPTSTGQQYDNVGRFPPEPQPTNTGVNANGSRFAVERSYQLPPGHGVSHGNHASQEQYSPWHQYHEQDPNSCQNQQQGYGNNQWR